MKGVYIIKLLNKMDASLKTKWIILHVHLLSWDVVWRHLGKWRRLLQSEFIATFQFWKHYLSQTTKSFSFLSVKLMLMGEDVQIRSKGQCYFLFKVILQKIISSMESTRPLLFSSAFFYGRELVLQFCKFLCKNSL